MRFVKNNDKHKYTIQKYTKISIYTESILFYYYKEKSKLIIGSYIFYLAPKGIFVHAQEKRLFFLLTEFIYIFKIRFGIYTSNQWYLNILCIFALFQV